MSMSIPLSFFLEFSAVPVSNRASLPNLEKGGVQIIKKTNKKRCDMDVYVDMCTDMRIGICIDINA